MELKTRLTHAALPVTHTDDHLSNETLGRSKVDPDRLADKLQRLPSAKISDRLPLLAAKLQKRQAARAASAQRAEVPANAAADASALEPTK